MNKPAQKIEWLVWGGLVLIIAGIVGAFLWFKVIAKPAPMPIIGQISNFTLTNQNNAPVTLADLRGKICVADIIFTRCPGPCTKMTRAMSKLQALLPTNEPIRLISLTSDPEYDTPEKLKSYSEKFGTDSNRWWFLTGKKPDIRSLAVNDFKFVMIDKKAEDRSVPEDLFIHSEWFILLDRQGRVRGWTTADGHLHAYFDLEDEGVQPQILAAVKQLLRDTTP